MDMKRYLMILEVSRKQDYIFSEKKLIENVNRSRDIAYVTSNEFFKTLAKGSYNETDNYVYAGGGHTIVEYPDKESADRFARVITLYVLEHYPGLEIFAKGIEYDDQAKEKKNEKENEKETASEAFLRLTQELEKKKSVRWESIRRLNFGGTQENTDVESAELGKIRREYPDMVAAPEGCVFPKDFDKLSFADDEYAYKSVKDNFLAVVHVDGNAMGTRVQNIYKSEDDFDKLKVKLRNFSESIQSQFEEAFSEMTQEVYRVYGDKLRLGSDRDPSERGLRILPVRPVVLAGDDVCFVTAGNIGLECARIFLEKLSTKVNKEDGKRYSACAGVAIVHRKYPFHMAYNMSEHLCGSAKKSGVELDVSGKYSLIDWHIEYGQLKEKLSEIREAYITDDGADMVLRPLVVINPDNERVEKELTYDYFKQTCLSFQKNNDNISRSKLKELRNAIKQGEIETEYYIKKNMMKNMMKNITGKDGVLFREIARSRAKDAVSVRHSLIFDAVEAMDNCYFLEEGR